MANLGKKVLVYGLCSMLASPFMVLPRQAYANTQNLTVYSGGTIYTMTESLKEVQNNVKPHKAKAVVVDNKTGKIIKVFKENENADMYTKNANYKQVNLGTNVMLPGFIDPHGHFPTASSGLTSIDLNPSPIGDPGVNTLAQLQDKLIQTAKENPDMYQYGISGSGYDDTLLDIKRHPTHEELSVRELGQKPVKIGHSSGHMSVVNTVALKQLFNTTYIQGTLTTTLKNQGVLTSTQSVASAQLIKSGTEIQYEITLNDGTKKTLPGIQMRKDDGKASFPINDAATAVNYMTGLLQESSAEFVAVTSIPAAKDQWIPYAAKDYISRGVTSANDGGTLAFGLALDDAQKALATNALPLRMVIQPRIYLNFGVNINEHTLQNHFTLGWTGMNYTAADEKDRTIGSPSANSPQTGDDITTWYGAFVPTPPGFTGTPATEQNHGKPGSEAADTTYANQLYKKFQADPVGYKDRIMLGTWKYNYDGSIQGYTGYLAQQGYYTKPADLTPFNPAGRTGDEAAGTGEYVVGGKPSVTDPKYFCVGGAHYGNEKSLGNGTYDSVQNAITQYHLQNQGVSLHLNGSWANDDVINFVEQAAFEAKKQGKNITDTRHTVIHAQMQDLQHIQRIMGNYDQFPIDTPRNVKKFTNVWTGVNAMTWQKGAQQDNSVNGYNPEEGSYLDQFATGKGNTGQDLRTALGGAGEQNLIRQQNMISSYFVDHTYYWGERHRDIFMGPGRAYNMSPMGWAVKLGHRYTFHNDTPVTPQNPLKSISVATTRLSSGYQAGGIKAQQQPIYGTAGIKEIGQTKKYYPTVEDKNSGDTSKMVEFHDFDQRITVLQALHAVTVNSAFSSKIEDRFGSIKEGNWADFVILAQDPFELEKQGTTGLLAIADIPVVTTIVGNNAVFGFLPGTTEGNFVSYLEGSFFDASLAGSTIQTISENADDFTDPASFVPEATLAEAGKSLGKAYLGNVQFTSKIGGTKTVAIYSAQIMGNGDPVSTVKLHKFITPANIKPFTLVGADFDKTQVQTYAGKFWITGKKLDTVLTENDKLEIGNAYYIHFAIEDDSEFDLDKTNKIIQDPVIVTADSLPKAPTAPYAGHGGGGGCTIGTSAQYDLALVILAAFGLLAIRIYRKRDNA